MSASQPSSHFSCIVLRQGFLELYNSVGYMYMYNRYVRTSWVHVGLNHSKIGLASLVRIQIDCRDALRQDYIDVWDGLSNTIATKCLMT